MNVPDFISEDWTSNPKGELLVGSVPISAITGAHGTPVFVYDRAILERKYHSLRSALPARFSISYSVKANPNPAILQFFLGKKCGLEIASTGEFHLAMSAGCRPEHIVFAGPGKSEDELETVIAAGIAEIHAESKIEIERISKISAKLGLRTAVSVRVNPTEESQGGAMRMGGKPAPFGIDEEQLEGALERIANDRRLEFRGIHLYVGTQILDHDLLLAQYRKAVQIARRAATQMRSPIRTLDFGGGLGIPYFAGESELNLARFGEGLRELMVEIENEGVFRETNFMVEPGRFLVGAAGVYVARINDIKRSCGRKYLILDGGMNHHLAASGNLGQVIKRNFPIAILNRTHQPATDVVDVVGPLCTPLDIVGRSLHLPEAEIGDLVGIFQSGAYARSASPLAFLSHPTPPEVWVEDGRDFLIRRRGSWEDYMRDVVSMDAGIHCASCTHD
jgi:diaminopimelate decarboxylase